MDRNIFAYTAPSSDYPEFVSVNERDGNLIMTVRGPKKDGNEGATVDVALSRDEARNLYISLMHWLIPTNAA